MTFTHAMISNGLQFVKCNWEERKEGREEGGRREGGSSSSSSSESTDGLSVTQNGQLAAESLNTLQDLNPCLPRPAVFALLESS